MFVTNKAHLIADNAGRVSFVSRLGPRGLEALISAAAEMALADGQADAVEHRSLLAFMRQEKILASFGRSETIRRFTSEVQRASVQATNAGAVDDRGQRWLELTDRLRPLAGMATASTIMAAAVHVAAADGVVHPEEAALLRCLSIVLNLEPTGLGEQA